MNIPNNIISMNNALSGEYRAILREGDENGAIKYDSGWQSNHILNQGLQKVLSNLSCMAYMSIGTSATAVADAQTGLQGSFLARVAMDYQNRTTEGVAPLYRLGILENGVYGAGTGTGTINEFVLHESASGADYNTGAAVRVVLTAPIVKGASDHLTIQHIVYVYPDVTDKSGVITISGVDYNYVMRAFGLDQVGYVSARSSQFLWFFKIGNSGITATNEPLDILTGDPDVSPQVAGGGTYAVTYGGAAPNFYADHEMTSSVDQLNGTFTKLTLYSWYQTGAGGYYKGVNITLDKVIGGGGFVKENTHEFKIKVRTYSSRYIP